MRRTITLSDRPPIVVEEDDWPLIAKGSTLEGAFLGVRQHRDGRAIVYGVATVGHTRIREGTMLSLRDASTEAICQTIREVGSWLESEDVWLGDLISQCIGSLPAEEID